MSDANGRFSLTLPAGFYQLDVTKGGYVPTSVSDLALFLGETTPVFVTLNYADLSSLRTIGTMGESGGTNQETASVGYLSRQAVQDFANPQINDVLQHMPDTVVEHLGTQPDTTIVLGGVQPYETQVLIDGHPLSMGQYGAWLSEYYPSFLVDGVETQIGPGNTTPLANTAVGGTANLVTPAFTSAEKSEFVTGSDSFDSQYSHILTSGSLGKMQYVLGAGYGSSNGPFLEGTHCIVFPDNSANSNSPQSVGVVQSCGDSSGSLFTKGEILKFRYNLSPYTALDLGYIGAQGGYYSLGAAQGQYLGATRIVQCLPSIPLACGNPAYGNLTGQSIDAYAWSPGQTVLSNQPIFTAQLRTTLGNDTLLIRPYAGNIERTVAGDPQAYPFAFGPPGGQNAAFEALCNFLTRSHIGSLQTTPPTVVSGQEVCWRYPSTQYEQDKLYGATLTYLHPTSNGLLNFTYDYHGDGTFAYYSNSDDVSTPPTTERYSTVSVSADQRIARNVDMKAALYDTMWNVDGVQVQPGVPLGSSPTTLPVVGLNRTLSHFDPHVGFVYQPTAAVAVRAAYGTSETFPYASQISGLPFYTQPTPTFPTAFVTPKNPSLNMETSSETNVGADFQFHRGGVLSADLENINIHNVFEMLVTPNAIPIPGQSTGIPSSQPINVAQLKAQVATLRYTYAPNVGLGYNASVAFEKSALNGIPNSFYSAGPALPVNGQQICGFGQNTPGSTTCIPYVKGYAQATFTTRDRTFVGLGVDFEGKNNTYFQPPFALWDLTVRRPVSSGLDVQIAVQNLLNTNNFANAPMPNMGVSTVAGNVTNGAFGLVSLPSVLIPAPPRTVRVELRWHSN